MNKNNAVLCITLNPALDLTGNLQNIRLGKVNAITDANLHPAGKGVNVAKVLAELGANVCVSGFLGIENASAFEALFDQHNITDEFVRVAGATRTNVKVVACSGAVTDLNFPGFSITEQTITAFNNKLEQLCQHYAYVVFAGSLPKGLPASQLAGWIKLAKNKGCKVLVDTSGEALIAAIEAAPHMIKPNQDELEELCQQALNSIDDIKLPSANLALKGIEHVVISRGEKGALWLHRERWMQAQPPSMKVVSTVGAGDTFVASFCWGLIQQFDPIQQLNFASAMSALAVAQTNVGLPALDALAKVQQQTIITQL
ncbi:1-phosphofructokinase [Agarivorans sp. MS3-6]|uniref:1-phosphofructokinase n=1 Tax=Agarivorans sp. TSD2052 TaxID=2937286 RepID=UPI00200BA46D|nr:1-phosphofructokinase [Agarivorans sp. TSD2052]UPW16820.1 1-phosphofructokinase [Agarivorans sp. TSD2052]